jgi:acetoacetyl-CoA reductase
MALQVSLVSAFQLMQAFIPGMVERGWGRVINFGGLSGQTGARNRSSVSATKAGLAGLSRTIALEVAEHGVTVNTVSPGPIETARGEWTTTGDLTALSELYEKRRQAIPVKRRGSIDEVVALCEYLASDRAGFMTGQNIQLNGGLLMT